MRNGPRLVVDNTKPVNRSPSRSGIVFGACMLAAFGTGAALNGLVPPQVTGIDTTTLSALPRNPSLSLAPRPMPVCRGSVRFNCVVDGDTVWIDGEKIRILNLDAPEVKGACAKESRIAAEATRHLIRIVSDQPLAIMRDGEDRYGRTLARIVTPDGDAGQLLIGTGTAARWNPGNRRDWCR